MRTLAIGFVFFVSTGSALGYEPIAVTDGGIISGTVTYTGTAAPPPQLEITKDPDYCGKTPIFGEQLVVSAGKGLKWGVVFLEKIASGKAVQPGAATLQNSKCHYEPHVQAFVVGTELAVGNSDPILHNTHIKLPDSDVANYALPMQGQVIKKKVMRKGMMKVGCDAGHVWMSAWIAVFDHPYFAVTDAEGRFSFGDVPPGSYTLVLWHEKLGKRTQPVTVVAKGTARVDFKVQ